MKNTKRTTRQSDNTFPRATLIANYLPECVATHGDEDGRRLAEEIVQEIEFGTDRICRGCRRTTIERRCICGRWTSAS